MDNTRPLYVKGTGVDAARRFLLRQRSHPEWEAFLAELTAEQRTMIDRPVSKRRWFVVSDYIALLESAGRHFAPDAPNRYMRDVGAFVMEDGLTTLYKMFFAIVSPAFTIRLSALFWRQFYKPSRLIIVDKGRRSVHGAVVDAPYCAEALCHTIRGAMARALEQAGARDVEAVHHSCQSAGGSRCDYHFAWR